MGEKMNLRMIKKNHEADQEKVFLTKSISKPYDRATAMPPAWELTLGSNIIPKNFACKSSFLQI